MVALSPVSSARSFRLKDDPEITIIGECSNGFEVLGAAGPDVGSVIIFVTANNRFALKAFEDTRAYATEDSPEDLDRAIGEFLAGKPVAGKMKAGGSPPR